MAFDLILASSSPRRRELLSLMKLSFLIDAPDVNEETPLGAREAVQELARRKALAAAALHPGEIVLAADTLVSIEDRPLGKPCDEAEACSMLRMLCNHWHQVYTGVCIIDREGNLHEGLDASDVRFGDMSDEDIRRYVATGEPMDKAGAYALQGGAQAWIEEVRGTPSGVIGLPLPMVRRLLRECGVSGI